MATLHACLAEGTDAQLAVRAIKIRLARRHGIDHATVEPEFGHCADPHRTRSLMDRETRGAAIAAAVLMLVFGVGAFYLPTLVIALGDVSPFAGAAAAVALRRGVLPGVLAEGPQPGAGR